MFLGPRGHFSLSKILQLFIQKCLFKTSIILKKHFKTYLFHYSIPRTVLRNTPMSKRRRKKTLGLTHICMFCWLAIIFGECSQSSIHQKGYEGCKPLFAATVALPPQLSMPSMYVAWQAARCRTTTAEFDYSTILFTIQRGFNNSIEIV